MVLVCGRCGVVVLVGVVTWRCGVVLVGVVRE